jgi:hypothetical protein
MPREVSDSRGTSQDFQEKTRLFVSRYKQTMVLATIFQSGSSATESSNSRYLLYVN